MRKRKDSVLESDIGFFVYSSYVSKAWEVSPCFVYASKEGMKMSETKISNYERMKKQMQAKFVSYDQEKMIEKFSLKSDDTYLYVRFIGREYRIHRKTGLTEWSEDQFRTVTEAGYNEAMTIFDVLCDSKENCQLAGKYCPPGSLKGIVKLSQSHTDFFQPTADYLAGKLDRFQQVCDKIGQRIDLKGDVAVKVMVFDFLPMIIQFWDADEEFPACLKFMVDENIQDFMRYETMMFMLSYICGWLEECVG